MMMKHITEFDNLTRVTRRREFVDGLADFVFAIVFLILGLFGWLLFSPNVLKWYVTALVRNREITIMGTILLASFLFLIILGARRMVDQIRRNIIWKDRGFVKSLRWQVNWRYSLLAVAITIMLISVAFLLMLRGMVNPETVLRAIVSSAGIATGIVCIGLGMELGIKRYKWVGIAGGIFSAIIIILPISFSISWLLLGIAWVIILTLSGSYALRQSLSAREEIASE
jgi:hypothetical protein